MKKTIAVLAGILGVFLLLVGISAVLKICPPAGPWPMPPWCEGSSIPWPFGKSTPSSAASSNPTVDDSMSENERLGIVAIGLIQDLTSVNTYFNQASSSMSHIQLTSAALSRSATSGKVLASVAFAAPRSQAGGQIPDGFLAPLPADGYIQAPAGACALGALPSASFLSGSGEKITPAFLEKKNVSVISFGELTGGSIDGNKLQQTITSLIVPGDTALASAKGWNEKVWNKLKEKQTKATSMMDYYLWTIADEIENKVVDSMLAQMKTMNLPSQVTNAFKASNTKGWYASKSAGEADNLAAMEITAVFTGKTEGTIREKRAFSIPTMGGMPEFGRMTGEGEVVYHDPKYGDYPFELAIDWTGWDELGRVNAGTIDFLNEEKDIEIKLVVNADNSRVAEIFRKDVKVGIVRVDSRGNSSYEEIVK